MLKRRHNVKKPNLISINLLRVVLKMQSVDDVEMCSFWWIYSTFPWGGNSPLGFSFYFKVFSLNINSVVMFVFCFHPPTMTQIALATPQNNIKRRKKLKWKERKQLRLDNRNGQNDSRKDFTLTRVAILNQIWPKVTSALINTYSRRCVHRHVTPANLRQHAFIMHWLVAGF